MRHSLTHCLPTLTSARAWFPACIPPSKTTLMLASTIGLLSGCATLPSSLQGSNIDALRTEVSELQTTLANTQKSLLMFTAAEADQRTAVNEELEALDKHLERLPGRVSKACKEAESAPAQACRDAQTVIKIEDRMVVGDLEHVWLEPPGISLTARIDTGAESSSVNAQNLVEFERDGDDWVRFEWALASETITIERPIERYVRIVQQADPEGTRRPVVSLRLRIGDVANDFDFSLADRSHLDHQMNLGRNFLTDVAVVDVGRQFVQPAITGSAE